LCRLLELLPAQLKMSYPRRNQRRTVGHAGPDKPAPYPDTGASSLPSGFPRIKCGAGSIEHGMTACCKLRGRNSTC